MGDQGVAKFTLSLTPHADYHRLSGERTFITRGASYSVSLSKRVRENIRERFRHSTVCKLCY